MVMFLLTRLVGLTDGSLHYDEATYLHWGMVISEDWDQRYIGATGGKQPLHPWLMALSQIVFPGRVFAGRLLSVLAGGVAAVALWKVAARLYSRNVAIGAVGLYILCFLPFTYDRQGLADSLLMAEALWMMYLAIALLDKPTMIKGVGMAAAFGAALLTKSVGWAFVVLLPASLLAVRPAEWSAKRLLPWAGTLLASLFGGFMIYYIAFGAHPAAELIGQHEQNFGQYTLSGEEILSFPWSAWQENAQAIFQTIQRLTLPFWAVAAAALLATPWIGRQSWILACWVIFPIAGFIIISARYYPRYILFTIPPLLLLTAAFLNKVYTKLASWSFVKDKQPGPWPLAAVLGIVAALAIGTPMMIKEVQTIAQYEEGGRFYGLYAMQEYLAQQASENPLYVIVNKSPSPVEDGTAVLLHDVPNVTVLRLAPFEGKWAIVDPATNEGYPHQFFQNKELYYVHGPSSLDWINDQIELVHDFPNYRQSDKSSIGLYTIQFDEAFY